MMRLSTLFGRTLREPPSEAEQVAYQLVLRAGLARPLLAGGYALLPLGMRVARRIEAIMHEELARIDAQELRSPIVQPAELWEQSGRYSAYGPLMLRLADRGKRPLIVAPTHEEAIAELARREISSYRHMPALVYQVHTKYRDELRTKGGLMRMREFTMLDAYSLDADHAGLDRSYEQIATAFERIFTRCGVRFVAVEASAGEMGGREPREYMALSSSGEDTLVVCSACGYAANLEVAVSGPTTDDRRPTTDPDDKVTRRQGDKVTGGEDAITPSEQSVVGGQWSMVGGREDDKVTRRQGDKVTGGEDAITPSEQSVVGGQWSVVGGREEVATPNCATIADVAAFLGLAEAQTAKAVFFDSPERGLIFAVIRGDLEVNEDKLRAAAGVTALTPASAKQIAAAGAVAGYASPVGLTVLDDENKEQRTKNKEQRTKNREPRTENQEPITEDGGWRMEDGRSRNTQHASGTADYELRTTNYEQTGVFVIADRSVVGAGPLAAGANRDGYHLRNVIYGRDWRATRVADIATVRAGDPCARCGAPLAFERGVEIGHIFKLGTRFSEALGATYLDQGGTERPIVMGSYGIGVERLLQIIVEQHHDNAGIIWPAEVAPLDVQLLRIGKSPAVRAAADELYEELRAAGVHALYDDREESPGVKFNDADLIGLPVRLVVSERLLAEQAVEVKPRGGAATKVARAEVLGAIRSNVSL